MVRVSEILTNEQLELVIQRARREIKAGRDKALWLFRLGKYVEMLDERLQAGTYTPNTRNHPR